MSDGAGDHRPRGASIRLGQPTVQIDIDRVRAARYGLSARRHQRDDRGGDRRPGRRQSLRGRQRPQFPDHRAAGAAIPREPRGHPPHHDRRAEPERQRHRADPADRCRRRSSSSPAPPSSIARTRSATSRSSSACAAAISAARCWRRSRRSRSRCRLPRGYRLEWVGEFGELQDAIERLAVVVPLSLALICVLLFVNFGSLTDMLLAASVMPMALIGGIFALVRHRHAVQRLGGDRLCRAVRHRGDGWHHRPLLLQPADR